VPEPGLGALRDAAEAGVRYYAKLGGLALELAETLVPSVGGLRPRLNMTPDLPPRAEVEPAAPKEQTIVIEAPAGRKGLGVFMVENTTAQTVSAPVGVSTFAAADGREATLEVAFSPEEVSLDPGDQVLVQVAAAVDESLEPDLRYRAEISIPSLSGATIPLVVRRRPSRKKPQAKRRSA
jgi:hypothetical protein